MSKFEIVIATVPDRENVVAEIWHGKQMLAEVSNEDGGYIVELYPREITRISLQAFLDILTEAQKKLSGS